jgi:hypothetical protein
MLAAWALPARAADEPKMRAATRTIETGAKKIGDGVEETARGVGSTIVGGAKYTGEKLRDGGKKAEPEARSAWTAVRDGAVDLGHRVKNFFSRGF